MKSTGVMLDAHKTSVKEIHDEKPKNRQVAMKVSSLRAAILQRDVSAVQRILKAPETTFGLKQMWPELEKLQPLHLSVWRSSAAVLAILLQCDVIGRLIESRDERGFTPLVLAALRGRTDCIQALLAEGADIHAVDSTKGHTALHKAALTGHRDALRLLINAAPDEIDKADFCGNTALMSAVSKGHIHCFQVLVNAGADCSLRTLRKQTVLHLAAAKGHVEMLRAMLELPALRALLRTKPPIKDIDGRTCLVLAVLAASAPCVNLLLQTGDSLLSEIQEPWQQNPLYLAASRGSNEILQLLLMSYEYRHLHPSSEEGIEAARFGEVFLEDILILNGTRAFPIVENILEDRECDPRQSHIFPEYTKAIGRYKNTCLHLAAQSGNVETLETLYCCYASIGKRRVTVNCRDLDRRNALHQTPLHISAMTGASECTKFLVQRGANLAATINEPLWYEMRPESSALSFILEHVPRGEDILCEVLDGCITLVGYLLGQQEILLDFRVLCPVGENRLTVVEQLYRHRERRMHNLLQHPLVQTFIHLEWCKKRYSLVITLHFLIYLLYVSTLAIYLLVAMNNSIQKAIKLFLIILCVIVLTAGTPFLVLCHVSRPEKLYKIMTKTAPPVLTLVALPMDYKPLSSFALIFSWLALLHYTNSIPVISHKSAMFQYIMKKLVDHIIVFVFILAGFSFTFFLLYSDDKTGTFQDLWESVLSTTLVLLQGSLDGTPLFKNSSQTSIPQDIQIAGGLMQQLFVVTAVLALLNMWVGLAVRGGQELEDQGRIHFRRNQVQLLFVLEKLFQLAGLHDPKSPDSVRLCEAIMLSDSDEVDRLLNGSSKINMEDCYAKGVLPRYMTLVHIAAKKREEAYLEKLLKKETFGKVDTVDELGYTPLMHAADAGSFKNVQFLLKHNGVDISVTSKSRSETTLNIQQSPNSGKSADRKPDRSLQKCLQRTVLHIAAGRGYKEILEELLKKSNESLINQVDDNGWTPLFWAARSGNLECFKLLLGNKSCSKDTCDNSKRNVLHIIAEYNCHEILKEFCKEYETSNINQLSTQKGHELTPFMTSVCRGNVETAKLLMSYEQKLHKDTNGNTVFHLAAERGRYDTLQFLLSPQLKKLKMLLHDDTVFLTNEKQTGTTSADNTLLHEVVETANISESVHHQFNNMWYPDELKKENVDGNNCFHLAAGSGDIHCLRILYACCITMQQGFISFPLEYLDMKNKSQATPLHYAISSRSREVIKFLVTHGADLMSRTKLLPILPNTTNEVGEKRVSDESDGSHDETGGHDYSITCMQRENPTSLHYILKMANGASIIKELLNESVTYRKNEDDKYEIVVDFQLLICNSGLRMAITHEIFRQGHAGLMDVLLHPLLKSFIETEWLKRKYFPWFRVTTYILYLINLTLYAWLLPKAYFASQVIAYLVSILSVMILLFCVPYILPGKTTYERVKGIIQRILPPVFALVAISIGNVGENPLPFLSLAVTLSWLSLIFYSGTLTSLNQQAAQFQAVLFTMLRNVPVFSIVIFGFAFSFYVLYFEEDNFDNIWNAFLYTSVVMLQGGMDDSPYFSRNTTQVAQETLFAGGTISFLFVVVVTLALLNMLVGLAISSAEELRNEGRLVFMRHQVTLLFELDQIMEMFKYLHVTKLWDKIRGVESYSVTPPDAKANDHRMVVNNDNTSLENLIELHDIAKKQLRPQKLRNDHRGSP